MTYRGQIESALKATVLHSSTTYSWFGKRFGRLPPKVKQALTTRTARDYLLYSLQSRLYTDFYCPGFATSSKQDVTGSLVSGQTPFVRRLSAANTGKGYWQDGWKINEITEGEVVVQQGDLTLWVDKKKYLNLPEGSAVLPGVQVGLRFPKEFLGISPGFYMALSDIEMVGDGSQSLVRYYWNVTSEGAINLMQQVTLRLNQVGVPFKFKVLRDPDLYKRCDAAVLYVRKTDIDSVTSIVVEIYPQIKPYLKRGIPAFTKLMASGLGLAEDPGDGESFGMHRCQLLAEGVICAYEQGQKSIPDRLRMVEECFIKAGISLDAPYLNPDSSDIYKFHFDLGNPLNVPYHQALIADKHSMSPSFLQTASEIGQRLVQTAIWYDGKCNWLGFESEGATLNSRQSGVNYSALGPDLYMGTAGIALFLGELFVITGNKDARRTALGAIYQALSRCKILPSSIRLGFFTGWPGIAYAAVRLGILMNEEKLINQGKMLLHQIISGKFSERQFDLLSGNAGAIVALIVPHQFLNDISLLKYAIRLGDHLIKTAEKSPIGYSWRSVAFPKQPHLTGFSHGTAGVGYALLELSQATGNLKYREAAEQAFSYERYWFDPHTNNWPDFREETRRPRKGRYDFSFATFWCHGAPGIALSRLRAFEIYKDPICQMEAMTALETTRQQIMLWLQSGSGNYSLCHGLTGNADVIIYGSQVLGDELAWGTDLAKEVASNGIDLYARRGHKWPCGSGIGESPGLMLGLAGIGYFYLRLVDPSIPSPLLLQNKIS
jgi:hypothetical protein